MSKTEKKEPAVAGSPTPKKKRGRKSTRTAKRKKKVTRTSI